VRFTDRSVLVGSYTPDRDPVWQVEAADALDMGIAYCSVAHIDEP
jgi:hypothetical protein